MLWNCQMWSTELRNFYEYSEVLKGLPRKRFWSDFGGPWGTQSALFRRQLERFCCFQEGSNFESSRSDFVFQVFCKFESAVFADSCSGFAVFLNSRARGVLGFFEILGVPEGSFLTQLQRFWSFQGSLKS